jgi:hypothetical protein
MFGLILVVSILAWVGPCQGRESHCELALTNFSLPPKLQNLLDRASFTDPLVINIANELVQADPVGQWIVPLHGDGTEARVGGSVRRNEAVLEVQIRDFFTQNCPSQERVWILPKVFLGIFSGIARIVELHPEIRTVRLVAGPVVNYALDRPLKNYGFKIESSAFYPTLKLRSKAPSSRMEQLRTQWLELMRSVFIFDSPQIPSKTI